MNCLVVFGKTDELRRPFALAGWFGFGRLPNWSNTAEYNDRQILSQHSNGPFANLEGRDRQKDGETIESSKS